MTDQAARDARMKALYEEIDAKQKELVELLKSGGPEPVEDYVLKGAEGEDVRLSDLFGDKSDLILVHNMGSSCPYCTLWADGLNGVVHHLEDRAGFVVVSPDAPAVQQSFAASRGWRFRMASAAGSSFTKDLGFEAEHEGKAWPMPGCSTFRKGEDGRIERVAKTFFGPGDPYCAVFHLFPLLADGTGDWQAKLDYAVEAST
jgi:predicted dithiol-disulfide oxidoreductase (DUF899 family)